MKVYGWKVILNRNTRTLSYDISTELCVVGGGFIGLTSVFWGYMISGTEKINKSKIKGEYQCYLKS